MGCDRRRVAPDGANAGLACAVRVAGTAFATHGGEALRVCLQAVHDVAELRLPLGALLLAYRSGLIKATENFKLGVVAALGLVPAFTPPGFAVPITAQSLGVMLVVGVLTVVPGRATRRSRGSTLPGQERILAQAFQASLIQQRQPWNSCSKTSGAGRSWGSLLRSSGYQQQA